MPTDPFKKKKKKKKNERSFIFFPVSIVKIQRPPYCTAFVIRSYEGETTASHPNCEVKHLSAQSVLQWGTMWES